MSFPLFCGGGGMRSNKQLDVLLNRGLLGFYDLRTKNINCETCF